MKVTITLFLIMLAGSQLLAQEPTEMASEQKVRVRVDGLSCSFCAYGLEKKLLKIEGVKAVEISIDDGAALLTLDKDAEIGEEVIKKEVKDAGFTPREIVYINE
ncbi:MAG: copper chaperone [Bacteroidetes bacterium]|nr:MAG: copper chaperone [Bacteroidota bacterium]